MVLKIRQVTPAVFDLYTVVEIVLAGVMENHDSTWTSANLYISEGFGAYVEGHDLQFDGDGYLISGTVTSLTFGVPQMGEYVLLSGLSFDIAAALLAPWGQYPAAVNPTIDYSAKDFHPGYDPYGNPWPTGVTFTGDSGNDTIRGSDFADELGGSSGDDRIVGAKGDDWLYGGPGKDTLDGGEGYDFLDYSTSTKSVSVKLTGSAPATVKIGGVAQDQISRIEGLLGSSKGDNLVGGGGVNVFAGLGGKDTLDGGGEYDTVHYSEKSKPVNVTLNGSSFASVKVDGVVEDKIRNFENVFGGTGGDRLTGDSRHNVLSGYKGRDTLSGGTGNDVLDGGAGKDVLRGGDGYDQFFFQHAGASHADIIVDFISGRDTIVLGASLYGEHQVRDENIRVGTAAKDGNDFLIYDRNTGRVYYDKDGVGGQDQKLIFTFAELPRTLYSDSFFVLI